jgi:hypothetical protein
MGLPQSPSIRQEAPFSKQRAQKVRFEIGSEAGSLVRGLDVESRGVLEFYMFSDV